MEAGCHRREYIYREGSQWRALSIAVCSRTIKRSYKVFTRRHKPRLRSPRLEQKRPYYRGGPETLLEARSAAGSLTPTLLDPSVPVTAKTHLGVGSLGRRPGRRQSPRDRAGERRALGSGARPEGCSLGPCGRSWQRPGAPRMGQ